MRICGGQALVAGEFLETDIAVDEAAGLIAAVGRDGGHGRCFDAGGLYVLPGIVDIHADAFERQLMPRPGVGFPIDVALMDSDRQVLGNGITTIFHGVTWSWEPGLRSADNALAILDAIETMRPRLAADTRFHLRHETFNLEAEEEISAWLGCGRIGMLGFNDHMPPQDVSRSRNLATMVQRSGLPREEFLALVERHAVAFSRRHEPRAAPLVPRARLPTV